MNKSRGKFITFEGVEGSGKSTHAKFLYGYLKARGYKALLTREPGGTAIGDRVRDVLLDKKNKGMSLACELFLYMACRAEIVKEIIRPALEKGLIVISDRFGDAASVYQGYAGGVDAGIIRKLTDFATNGLKPDLTILLDIDPRIGFDRIRKRKGLDRMESKPLSFHRRVREGYLKLAAAKKGRIKLITAGGDIRDTQALVRKMARECLSIR